MKVLLAATPLMGHLNPLLAIGYMLIKEGHEVVGVSSTVMGSRIEGIGAKFRPFPAEADLDLHDIATAFPEIKTIAPGPEMSRFYMGARIHRSHSGATGGPAGGAARLSC